MAVLASAMSIMDFLASSMMEKGNMEEACTLRLTAGMISEVQVVLAMTVSQYDHGVIDGTAHGWSKWGACTP